jgi:hypothetical protein
VCTTPAAQQWRLDSSIPIAGTTMAINSSTVLSCPLRKKFDKLETSCLALPLAAGVVVGWCAHHAGCNRLHRTLTDHHRRLGTGLSRARNVATPLNLRPPRLSARHGAGATIRCGARRQSSGRPLAANLECLRRPSSSQPFRCTEHKSDALLDLNSLGEWYHDMRPIVTNMLVRQPDCACMHTDGHT